MIQYIADMLRIGVCLYSDNYNTLFPLLPYISLANYPERTLAFHNRFHIAGIQTTPL